MKSGVRSQNLELRKKWSGFWLLASGFLFITSAGAKDTCVECHTEVAAKYKSTVHEVNAITCIDCHGGDPSNSSKLESHAGGVKPVSHISKEAIDRSCGECHKLELTYYEKSPHRGALQGLEVISCGSCHDVHISPKTDRQMFVKNCQECHEPTTDDAKAGLKSLREIAVVDGHYQELEPIVERLRVQAVSTYDMRPDLDRLTELRKSLGPLSHQTNQPNFDKATTEAAFLGKQLISELTKKTDVIRYRRLALIALWIFLAANIAVIVYKMRRETT